MSGEGCLLNPPACGQVHTCDEWLIDWAFQTDVHDPIIRSGQRAILWRALVNRYPAPVPRMEPNEGALDPEQLSTIKTDMSRSGVNDEHDQERLKKLMIEYVQSRLPEKVYLQGLGFIVGAIMREEWASDEDVYRIMWALMNGVTLGFETFRVPRMYIRRLLRYVGLQEEGLADETLSLVGTFGTRIKEVTSGGACIRIIDLALAIGLDASFAFYVSYLRRIKEIIFARLEALGNPKLPQFEVFPKHGERVGLIDAHLGEIMAEARNEFTFHRGELLKMTSSAYTPFETSEWPFEAANNKDMAAVRLAIWAGRTPIGREMTALPVDSPSAILEFERKMKRWLWEISSDEVNEAGRERIKQVLRAYNTVPPYAFQRVIGFLAKPIVVINDLPDADEDDHHKIGTALAMLLRLTKSMDFLHDPKICAMYVSMLDEHLMCPSTALFPGVECPLLLPFMYNIHAVVGQVLIDIGVVLGRPGWFAIYIELMRTLKVTAPAAAPCSPVQDLAGVVYTFGRGSQDRIYSIKSTYAAMRMELENIAATAADRMWALSDKKDPYENGYSVSIIHPTNAAATPTMVKIIVPASCAVSFNWKETTGDRTHVDNLQSALYSGRFNPCVDGAHYRESELTHTLMSDRTAFRCLGKAKKVVYLTCFFAVRSEVVELHKRVSLESDSPDGRIKCNSKSDSPEVVAECGLLLRSYHVALQAAESPSTTAAMGKYIIRREDPSIVEEGKRLVRPEGPSRQEGREPMGSRKRMADSASAPHMIQSKART